MEEQSKIKIQMMKIHKIMIWIKMRKFHPNKKMIDEFFKFNIYFSIGYKLN